MSDSRLRQALLVALVVVALDQVTKALVERSMTLYKSIPILPGFSLPYLRNTGAAFGCWRARRPCFACRSSSW